MYGCKERLSLVENIHREWPKSTIDPSALRSVDIKKRKNLLDVKYSLSFFYQ